MALPLPGTTLEGLGARGPLRLRRAWPVDDRELVLEYVDAVGTVVAGRAMAGRLELLAPGEDPRLPGLQTGASLDGARVLGHRAGRRAVIRAGDRFLKIVRPAKAVAVAQSARRAEAAAAAGGFAVPRLLDFDAPRGIVSLAGLPGQPLRDLLAAGDPAPAARAVGRALRALHETSTRDLPNHDACDEVTVLERWGRLLRSHAVAAPATRLADRVAAATEGVTARLLEQPAGPTVALHRDLHDGQTLIGRRGGVGLIDFDTLAAGEAALDLGNVLAHLVLAGLLGTAQAATRRAAEALLTGYRPDEALLARVSTYIDAARVRLACVYAFRPVAPCVPGGLIAPVPQGAPTRLAPL